MGSQELVMVAPSEAAVESARFMPVMNIESAIQRRRVISQAIKNLMEDGLDYGIIPGAPKPTLHQPGADKLNNLFGLVPRFAFTKEIEDWTGDQHGGEPFFYYAVKCTLWRGDYLMGEGDGSCNSWESKYRYRKAERVCPSCGAAAIIKGKQEYGGGWLCYLKKGGCGAKYKAGDQSIEEQETGRVANPDIYDLVNTVMKMANKRAKIAATLNATSAHEFFTQDIEDIPQVESSHPPPPVEAPPQERKVTSKLIEILQAFAQLKKRLEAINKDQNYYLILEQYGVQKSDQFADTKAGIEQARACYKEMLVTVKRLEQAAQEEEIPVEEEPIEAWPVTEVVKG